MSKETTAALLSSAHREDIRAGILKRANNRCEQCTLENGVRVARGAGSDAGTFMLDEEGQVYDAESGQLLGHCRASDYEVGRVTDVVLSLAHLDHDPENFEPSNLRMLCQRCHLAHGAAHNRAKAAQTRRSRKAMADLFD
jgi:5-methylcytosine-specific restriction endonuclease McrA